MSQEFLIRLNDSWHLEKSPQSLLLGRTKIYVARRYPKSQATENSLTSRHFPGNSSVLGEWTSECVRNGAWGMRGGKDTRQIRHSEHPCKERDTTALCIWWSNRCNSLFKYWTGEPFPASITIELWHKKWTRSSNSSAKKGALHPATVEKLCPSSTKHSLRKFCMQTHNPNLVSYGLRR